MKHTLSTLILILTCNSVSFSQKYDTSNFYYQALKMHLEYLDTFNNNLPIEASLIYHYYLINDSISDKYIPDQIGEFQITKLTDQEIRLLTRHGSGLHVISMKPIYMLHRFNHLDIDDIQIQRGFFHRKYLNIGGSSFQIETVSEDSTNLKILFQGLKTNN